MFLKMQDLGQFGQVSATAGGLVTGPRSIGRKRTHPSVLRARKAAVSGLGSNERAKNEAAETAALLKDVMTHAWRAEQAKMLLKQLKTAKTAVQVKASVSGLQGLGAWYDWVNPVNAYNYVVDKTADLIVGPMQAVTGYMVPTQKEVNDAKASVNTLVAKIETRTEAAQAATASGNAAAIAANPPVPETTQTAAQVGKDMVKDMQALRDSVIQIPAVNDVLKYLKWGAIIGGGLVAVAIVLPYVKAARAPAKLLA